MKPCVGVLVLISFLLMFVPFALLAQETQTKASQPQYIASRFSINYHRPTCKKALKIQEQNRITFNKAKEAIDAGYVPCPRCKPPTQD